MVPGRNRTLYRRMVPVDVSAVHALVHRTIASSYQDAYSIGAVEFFKRHHDIDSISRSVNEGHCILAVCDEVIASVGELLGNKIRMVFVEPSLQGMGVGKGLMMRLEDQARMHGLNELRLDSSVVAVGFYQHLGYEVVKETSLELEEGDSLPYLIMRRLL